MVMPKGDRSEFVLRIAAVFQDSSNKNPDIYNIPKPHPNPYPELNLSLGML